MEWAFLTERVYSPLAFDKCYRFWRPRISPASTTNLFRAYQQHRTSLASLALSRPFDARRVLFIGRLATPLWLLSAPFELWMPLSLSNVIQHWWALESCVELSYYQFDRVKLLQLYFWLTNVPLIIYTQISLVFVFASLNKSFSSFMQKDYTYIELSNVKFEKKKKFITERRNWDASRAWTSVSHKTRFIMASGSCLVFDITFVLQIFYWHTRDSFNDLIPHNPTIIFVRSTKTWATVINFYYQKLY